MASLTAVLGMTIMATTGNLITNGGFEDGMRGWSVSHDWYARPEGTGLSRVMVELDDRDGTGDSARTGGHALRIEGEGKRGIAMQVLPAYPGRYRVTGRLRCKGIDAGEAVVLCEWFEGGGRWLRGDSVARAAGTREWTVFETEVEAPAGTRSVHFDLLTTEPNGGTAWFDDLACVRIPSYLFPPPPPNLTVESPPGEDGCLRVSWDAGKLQEGAVRLIVYRSGAPGRDPYPAATETLEVVPGEAMDAGNGFGLLRSLHTGKAYAVTARLVDADGRVSGLSKTVTAKVRDRQPPRPGFVEAERTAAGARVSWSPHPLDDDIRRIHIVLPASGDRPERRLRSVEAIKLFSRSRPFFQTAPWLSVSVSLPRRADRIGVACEDRSGNRGPVAWTDIADPSPDAAPPGCVLWTAPPTESVPRTADPPTSAAAEFELRLMRGQAKGFQLVVRPENDLRNARVVFDPPLHEDGRTKIDPRWLAGHIVNFVRLESNSVATPKEELVWPAPSDYPDELSDDSRRDLSGGAAHPIYIRATAPRNTKPGRYQGRGWLASAAGRLPFRFTLVVERVALTDPVRLPFVYWFSWDAPCEKFGVPKESADGWRVLRGIARLMRAHHQRVVVVPWSLVRSWRRIDGQLVHDFSTFDRFLDTFRDAGVDQLFCLSHIGGRTTGEWDCPTMSSHPHSVRSLETGEDLPSMDAVDLLPALQAHIERKGLLDRFAVHVADEPIPVNLESYRRLSERVRRAAPNLKRIDAIHVPDLEGSLEIWVPQINYFEQWLPRYREAREKGSQVWFYVAWVPQGKYPNRMIDGGAIKPRILHWLNALYDTDGYLHWALNWWNISLSSLNSPGDQYICWPSRRFIANGSLRYEAEREGLEDCELLFMMRDSFVRRGDDRPTAQRKMESIGRKPVRSFQDYTRSWWEIEETRREILREMGNE